MCSVGCISSSQKYFHFQKNVKFNLISQISMFYISFLKNPQASPIFVTTKVQLDMDIYIYIYMYDRCFTIILGCEMYAWSAWLP